MINTMAINNQVAVANAPLDNTVKTRKEVLAEQKYEQKASGKRRSKGSKKK